MFNYEWQREFKRAYLDVAHQLNTRYTGQETIYEDCRRVMNLMVLCERYIAEREQERIQGKTITDSLIEWRWKDERQNSKSRE